MSRQLNYSAYKTCFVAEVRGRAVGVGTTADQAYRAAKQACPKDRPILKYVDDDGFAHLQPDNFEIWFANDLLKRVIGSLKKQGQPAYLVGGAVRDGLLGLKEIDDLDLLVSQNAMSVSRKLADDLGAAYFPIDASRDIGRVVLPNQEHIDVTSFRGDTLFDDLAHRDFTINAMALLLDAESPRIIDPLGGQADLQAKIIRVVNEAAIENDPLRSVRGVRQAASLGFTLTDETERLIKAGGPALRNVSPERLREELLKLLAVSAPGQAVGHLQALGLLIYLVPPAEAMIDVPQSPPHHLDVFEHTLKVMDFWPWLAEFSDERLAPLADLKPELTAYFQHSLAGVISRAELMPLVALLHDIGKPATFQRANDGRIRFFDHPKVGAKISKTLLKEFRFSLQASQFVSAIVTHHMRPLLLASQDSVSRRAIHRFLVATGDTAPAVALFSLIDHLAIYPPGQGTSEWARLLDVVGQICRSYFAPKLPTLVTGRDLIARFNLQPGPQIGVLLKQVREAQAVGEIASTDEALRLVENLLSS